MKSKLVYQCDYCEELSENPNLIKEHELKCSYNPDFKSCDTCVNYQYVFRCNCEYCLVSDITDKMFEEFKENGNCSFHKLKYE